MSNDSGNYYSKANQSKPLGEGGYLPDPPVGYHAQRFKRSEHYYNQRAAKYMENLTWSKTWRRMLGQRMGFYIVWKNEDRKELWKTLRDGITHYMRFSDWSELKVCSFLWIEKAHIAEEDYRHPPLRGDGSYRLIAECIYDEIGIKPTRMMKFLDMTYQVESYIRNFQLLSRKQKLKKAAHKLTNGFKMAYLNMEDRFVHNKQKLDDLQKQVDLLTERQKKEDK